MKTGIQATRQVVLSLIVTTVFLIAVVLNPNVADGQVKAFPTAEGFGANSVGGRGGTHIAVTNLNDSGPGSLRAALNTTGARIITFRVSGTINLSSQLCICSAGQSFVTIAGQTSPGGIQLKGPAYGGIFITSGARDVIIRHMRVRLGGPAPYNTGNNLLVFGSALAPVRNVIVDHSSVEWGTDTQLDAYDYFDNVTFQWNIIAEGAVDAINQGRLGTHVGGEGKFSNEMRITLHHNLWANNGQRSPLIQGAGLFDLRNNLIYNWGGNNAAVIGQLLNNTTAIGNIVNNHYIPGPNSTSPNFWLGNGGPTRIDGLPAARGGTKVYTSGNWGWFCPSGCVDDWVDFYTLDYYELGQSITPPANPAVFRAANPFTVPLVNTDLTSEVKNKVLATVGASKPFRDSLDQRIINEVNNGTGCISCIGYGGPWPTLTGGAPPLDSDGDGMPDAWEIAANCGSCRPTVADGHLVAANGYTHLENYLNQLAGDPIPGGGSPNPPPSNLQVSP